MCEKGIIAILIVLVPVAYQVFMLAYKTGKRHKEVMDILKRIEKSID